MTIQEFIGKLIKHYRYQTNRQLAWRLLALLAAGILIGLAI